MADILEHPMALAESWDFLDGSKVWIEAAPGKSLTVCECIYMLNDIQYRIHKMMYESN